MSDVEEICGHCRYWMDPWRPTGLDGKTPHECLKGTCYRFPPASINSSGEGVWPITWQYQGCGEFKQADTIVDLGSIR